MDVKHINGAELKLLKVIKSAPAPLITFQEQTQMNRTEIYDRLNGLIYKSLVTKKKLDSGVLVFCITEDGHNTLKGVEDKNNGDKSKKP